MKKSQLKQLIKECIDESNQVDHAQAKMWFNDQTFRKFSTRMSSDIMVAFKNGIQKKDIMEEIKQFCYMIFNQYKDIDINNPKKLQEMINESLDGPEAVYSYKASDGKVYKLEVSDDIETDEVLKKFHSAILPDGKGVDLHFSPYTEGRVEFKLWVELYIRTGGKIGGGSTSHGSNWYIDDLRKLAIENGIDEKSLAKTEVVR